MKSKDRGAAAVEFALMLPLLLLVIVGLINFGQAFMVQISLDHAAREGVRYAALGATATESQNRAIAAATGVPSVSANLSGSCPDAVMDVSVALEFWMPFPGFDSINLSAKGVAACYEE